MSQKDWEYVDPCDIASLVGCLCKVCNEPFQQGDIGIIESRRAVHLSCALEKGMTEFVTNMRGVIRQFSKLLRDINVIVPDLVYWADEKLLVLDRYSWELSWTFSSIEYLEEMPNDTTVIHGKNDKGKDGVLVKTEWQNLLEGCFYLTDTVEVHKSDGTILEVTQDERS